MSGSAATPLNQGVWIDDVKGRRKTRLSQRGALLAAEELLAAGVTILLLSTCVFLALRVLPGDPTTLILGDEASHEARTELRRRLMLDAPLGAQWLTFLGQTLRLEFGDSLTRPGVAASAAVARAMWPTAELAGLSIAMGAAAGVVAALFSVASRHPALRSWVHLGILAVASVPLLSFGPFATWLLAVRFPIVPLPGDPDGGLSGLLFAAVLLGLPLGAQVARVTRAALLDQRQARYLDVAKSKGAGAARIWFVHALPVAAPPVIVVIAMQLGALLGGAVVLERLFERPGLGTLMLEAYRARDLPVLQASVIVAGALFVLAQTLAQLLRAAIDPRRGEVRERE